MLSGWLSGEKNKDLAEIWDCIDRKLSKELPLDKLHSLYLKLTLICLCTVITGLKLRELYFMFCSSNWCYTEKVSLSYVERYIEFILLNF